ncbi:MAG: aquaporin [Anaerovoracaceae bacterium]
MKKLLAEFIGTFILVFFGCGSAVAINALIGGMGLTIPLGFTALLIAFAFGLSIMVLYYSFGSISGCHMNPAVSLAALVNGKFDKTSTFAGYVVAQLLGGVLGAGLLFLVTGQSSSLGQNGYGIGSALQTSITSAIIMEIVLTFVFVSIVLFVTSNEKYEAVGGLVIGFGLTLVHILGIPFTGTSVNPARSFGPAVFVGGDTLAQLPIFIVAPLVGALIAALLFKFFKSEPKIEPCSDEEIDGDEDQDYENIVIANTIDEEQQSEEIFTEPK